MIGPTGSGKSSIINLLFNKNITPAHAGATSVTREVIFHQGSCDFEKLVDGNKLNIKHPKINVIDTIGLCDTVMERNEVFNLIKDKLRTNVLHIDRVVIVCSGRLEKNHQIEIKQFMKWLRYKEYVTNFALIYNKCDGMEEGKSLKNLSIVCGMLGMNAAATIDCIKSRPTPLVISTGLPPCAPFQDINNEILRLQETILLPNCEFGEYFTKYEPDTRKRIPIEKRLCIIL